MNVTYSKLASPEQLFELVQCMIADAEQRASDKRIKDRYEAVVPVQLLSTDAELQPVSEPVRAVTKDISVGGIGLLSPSPAYGTMAIIGFEYNPNIAPVLIEVRHCRHVGPFFLIGGRFVSDWSRSDWSKTMAFSEG